MGQVTGPIKHGTIKTIERSASIQGYLEINCDTIM